MAGSSKPTGGRRRSSGPSRESASNEILSDQLATLFSAWDARFARIEVTLLELNRSVVMVQDDQRALKTSFDALAQRHEALRDELHTKHQQLSRAFESLSDQVLGEVAYTHASSSGPLARSLRLEATRLDGRGVRSPHQSMSLDRARATPRRVSKTGRAPPP